MPPVRCLPFERHEGRELALVSPTRLGATSPTSASSVGMQVSRGKGVHSEVSWTVEEVVVNLLCSAQMERVSWCGVMSMYSFTTRCLLRKLQTAQSLQVHRRAYQCSTNVSGVFRRPAGMAARCFSAAKTRKRSATGCAEMQLGVRI